MDPQLQEMGIFEAAYLLHMLTSKPNMTRDIMYAIQYDRGATRFFRAFYFLNMLRDPKHFIPPYDGKNSLIDWLFDWLID